VSNADELVEVIEVVARALHVHNVPYFVTGSLASSLHGEFRATNDIDIVAEFVTGQLTAFMSNVSDGFVADAEQAQRAIAARESFNLIHKTTYLKVDVFPVASEFNREAVRRAEPVTLPHGAVPVRMATKEDILLAKLNWSSSAASHRRGNGAILSA
jgi:hypothetical protein